MIILIKPIISQVLIEKLKIKSCQEKMIQLK